jgi:tellurite resistance protein TerC
MGSPLLWIGFNVFVLIALALDLGVFHRRARKIDLREALFWSVAWIALAVAFGYFVWRGYGAQKGLEYFTGYLIEKALSIDNLFVFLIIFRTYQVDERVQQRVLAWGILGALVMRGLMILMGAELVARFSWVLPTFGVFLVYTGLHMLWKREKAADYEKNPIFRFASKHLRVTKEYQGEDFFARVDGRLFATPLLLVLLIVEITDVTFAVDSIPAVFGITRDSFLVYTSNVFAIIGLRALYFLLADVLEYLRYIGIGLALVLVFIGGQMVTDRWWHLTTKMSLGVVGGILLATVVTSLAAGPRKDVQS